MEFEYEEIACNYPGNVKPFVFLAAALIRATDLFVRADRTVRPKRRRSTRTLRDAQPGLLPFPTTTNPS